MRVLIVCSHHDDEVIGCGGAICMHVDQGDDVYVCIVSGGFSVRYSDPNYNNSRKEHAKKAGKVLGIKDIFFCDMPTIMLDTIPQLDIVSAIEPIVYDIKPEVIYTHFGKEINSDHRIVHNSTIVWCRPSKSPFLKKVLLFEVLGSTKEFNPNYYVNLEKHLDRKLEALSIYSTEINDQTRTPETIKKLAAIRGAEVNLPYAEAFVVYHEIVP